MYNGSGTLDRSARGLADAATDGQTLCTHEMAALFSVKLRHGHSFVIFGMNHPEDSFYQENRKLFPNIIISLRSDDVIVTSSETTLRVYRLH